MCSTENIDLVLRRLERSRSAGEMRRLLKGAAPCGRCPDARGGARPEGDAGCACDRRRRLRLDNLLYTVLAGS